MPEADHPPALFPQRLIHQPIPLHVPLDLRNPISLVLADLLFLLRPVLAVPELAIAENGHFVLFECEIGLTEDGLVIPAVAVARMPDQLRQQIFRRCPRRSDRPHVLGADPVVSHPE